MHAYTFALSYLDKATYFIGIALVDILAESPEDAALKLGDLKHTPAWLMTVPALDIRDPEDLDGIIAGEFVLMKETITPPDCSERACALENEAGTPHDDEHAETRRAS